jgi:hypothetical protein
MAGNVEMVLDRWTNERPKFAKGALIRMNYATEKMADSYCCCAQGDAMIACGVPALELYHMHQVEADRKVADLLGISMFHSIMLREVNDSMDGCPENVLRFSDDGLGQVLGPNWRAAIALGEWIDASTGADLLDLCDRLRAAETAHFSDDGIVAAGTSVYEHVTQFRNLKHPALRAHSCASVAAGKSVMRGTRTRRVVATAMEEAVLWKADGSTPIHAIEMLGLDAAWMRSQNKRWR